MKQITCVFFGKSGAGKGTQADLLIKYLSEHDSEHKVVYVETGDRLRNFVKTGPSYSAGLVQDIISTGALMPAFFPIFMWSSLLTEKLSGKEHIVMDGVSRRADEAPILDSAIRFYKREKPVIFLLEIANKSATERLLKRGRHDDQHEKISKRLEWFDTDVIKAVSYFENNPYYTFVRINGDQTVEAVHKDILRALGI